jgi:hypothetical protein
MCLNFEGEGFLQREMGKSIGGSCGFAVSS